MGKDGGVRDESSWRSSSMEVFAGEQEEQNLTVRADVLSGFSTRENSRCRIHSEHIGAHPGLCWEPQTGLGCGNPGFQANDLR